MSKLRIDNVVKGNMVMHDHGIEDLPSGLGNPIVDTKANILARTGDSTGQLYYASDTVEFYVNSGSDTYVKVPFKLVTQSANPDMGAYQDSSHIGISPTYITDKLIANSRIGSNANKSNEGDVWVENGVFYVRLSSTNKAIVTGFVFRETGAGTPALEHQPIGYSWYYEVGSGNSVDNLDPDGNPLVQQYVANMGIYSTPLVIDGGTV